MNTRQRNCRGAFTLLELLIAMSISLVMLYAMILFLRYVGDTVTDGRAMIEISGQLRAVRQRLHDDLAMLTLPVMPLADVGGAPGYFMYYEGPRSEVDRDGDGKIDSDLNQDGTVDDTTPPDYVNDNAATLTRKLHAQNPWGDFDDVLAFTIYSKDEPLVGRSPSGAMVTADAAEVIWFCGFRDSPLGANVNTAEDSEMRFLFRRQLLVNPALVGTVTSYDVSPASGASINYPFTSASDARNGLINYQQKYDISVRLENTGSGWILKGNTLADLSRRENRFGIDATSSFPFAFGIDPNSIYTLANPPALPASQVSTAMAKYTLQDSRLGEDIQLSRCIGFDVRVYDAGAAVVQSTVDAGGPSDRLIDVNPVGVPAANMGTFGAFVDLGYNDWYLYDSATYINRGTSLFSGNYKAPATALRWMNRVYDTWSSTYERDGIDQDGDGITDEGTNGYDDDHFGGVDDVGERETVPPYTVPLRGIQVTIRVFDPDTKQQRQATVVGDFMPE